MGDAVVTFEQLVAAFPRITNRSKLFAKKVLPLRASPELAALVAALMTDGHVEVGKSDGRPRPKKVMLYSSNREECKWFLKVVKMLFGVDGKVQAYIPNHSNWVKQPYKAFVCNAAIARTLILAGAPAGNKTENGFLVPEWIMDGSREIKSEFLRAFFSFEGSKPMLKTNRQFSFQIDLTMVKSKHYLENVLCFFEQIKKLLLEFGVESTKTIYFQKRDCPKDYKYVFNFSIMRQKSIVN
ncbi:MAG: LAGLIDADG family homing endonuclease, partial [Candidatus Diapherotrites archaeon]|nr:LAGLIDADG family homing endonuclease [Candidatus Diapherotrites archaeon]